MFKLGSKERKVSTKIKECKTKNCIKYESTFYKEFEKIYNDLIKNILVKFDKRKNPKITDRFDINIDTVLKKLEKIKSNKKYKISQHKYDNYIIKCCYQTLSDNDIKVLLKITKKMKVFVDKQLKLKVSNTKLNFPDKSFILMYFNINDTFERLKKIYK